VAAELVIIGAGPAGVSAALWARSREIEPLVLEAGERAGGQLQHVYFHPRDVAGIETMTGPQLAEVYSRQLADAQVPVRYGTRAARLDSTKDAVTMTTESGERLEARAALIATGLRRRRLDVPGERELEGRGVSYSATHDRDMLAGRPVAVVGGGDAGFENALILVRAGCEVTLIVRDDPRARREFRDRVAAESRIRVIDRAHVTAIEGSDTVTAVTIDGAHGVARVPVEGVVIKVGEVPNTEWCRDAVRLDDDGYIEVDVRGRTSRDRVWAAGDVTGPPLLAVTVAAGSAALAVADIRKSIKGA
jgi:thioredoxin reductase (NADPH)